MSSLFKLFRYMLPLRKSDTNLNQELWEAKPAEPKKLTVSHSRKISVKFSAFSLWMNLSGWCWPWFLVRASRSLESSESSVNSLTLSSRAPFVIFFAGEPFLSSLPLSWLISGVSFNHSAGTHCHSFCAPRKRALTRVPCGRAGRFVLPSVNLATRLVPRACVGNVANSLARASSLILACNLAARPDPVLCDKSSCAALASARRFLDDFRLCCSVGKAFQSSASLLRFKLFAGFGGILCIQRRSSNVDYESNPHPWFPVTYHR